MNHLLKYVKIYDFPYYDDKLKLFKLFGEEWRSMNGKSFVGPCVEIVKKSKEFDPDFEKGKFHMVTAARLENQKAHLRALPVFLKLHNEGYDFCWHILGNGVLENDIKTFIEKYYREDQLVL